MAQLDIWRTACIWYRYYVGIGMHLTLGIHYIGHIKWDLSMHIETEKPD